MEVTPGSTERPTVSVALATFNGERFLSSQLESLARQTHPPDELIVGDDGSTDATLEILRQFALRAPFRVEVTEHPKRLGYSGNFIATARRCQGDLVFFCDQDDIWSPDKIRVIADIALRHPEEVISHDISVFSTGVSAPGFPSYFHHLDQAGLSRALCLKGCAMAVKAGFLAKWGWPAGDSGVSYDVWIALLATAFGQRRYCAEPLLSHRLHDANASGWIASASDRVRSRGWTAQQRALQGDTELLVELVLKRWNIGWTDEFLRAVSERRSELDPVLVAALTGSLEANRHSHSRWRRWWRF